MKAPHNPPKGGRANDNAEFKTADTFLYGLLKEYSIENRKHPTQAESIMWQFLRGQSLGVKFRRQHIIGPYIADFACLSLKIIIELGGGYHQLPSQQDSDAERTEWLENKGYKVIRFSNEEVIANLEKIIKQIKQLINEK